MGYLPDAMSPEKVDGQRDVVKNERRQSYENRPYGMAWIILGESLYPADHPYHWPTIGSMEDLSAASFDDVVEFFRLYYAPNNASLSIGGDIDIPETKRLVEKWFGEIPRGASVPPVDAPVIHMTAEKKLTYEDRVQLPRLYMAWHTPAHFAPGDAEMDIVANILTANKSSRLYKRLVYDLQIAQSVNAFQSSSKLSSTFMIIATARAGHTLEELQAVIEEEIASLKISPPSPVEVQRAVNQFEAGFIDRLESVGSFGGKVDQLNSYYYHTGNPDYFNEDLARYKAVDPVDVQAAVTTNLKEDARVVLSIVPKGKTELAIPGGQEVKK
jgi:zinc protease